MAFKRIDLTKDDVIKCEVDTELMSTNEWVSTQIWQLCIHRLPDLELRNSIKGYCSSENLENTYSDIVCHSAAWKKV